MNGAHVAITADVEGDSVRIACFLTDDPQIDGGLEPYLRRSELEPIDYKQDVVGSQMFTLRFRSRQELSEIFSVVRMYYVSWGKEPSIKSPDDIIH